MKQEMLEIAEERNKLMKEIYQQFQMLEIDPRCLEAIELKSIDGKHKYLLVTGKFMLYPQIHI